MAKPSKLCLDEALTALNHFNSDELSEYVRDVFNRARKMENLSSARAFDTAIKEINNERLQSFFESSTTKAANTVKFEKEAGKIRSKKETVRSLLTKRYTNLGDNVASSQWAARSRLARKAFDPLSEEEISYLQDPNNQRTIADAMDGRKVNNPTAEKIAKQFHEYIEYRNAELIGSTAMRFDEMNKDRNLRFIHNADKIVRAGRSFINALRDDKKYDTKASKNIWMEAIKKHFEMEGTFENTDAMDLDGNIDWKKADQILSNIYDNITTGKSEIFTRSSVRNDREAVERRSRMFFKPKSMRDFVEYNEKFGMGDLHSAWIADIHGAGAKVGMAEMWGDSPYNMFNDLRHTTQEVDPKDNFWWSNTDNYLKTVMGLDKAARSASVANFGANLRTLTSMARLIKVSLQSVSDVGYIASFGQRMGIGYWRTWFNQMSHLFDKFPTEERSRIAKLCRVMVDSHMGYMGRWVDAANSSQILSKASTGYFKKIGLEALDRGNKIGIMHLMSQHLYENSGSKFSELNPSLQKWVGKFMNENEWELLRKKNQGKLFTVENVDSLTDADLKAHYETTDKKTPLYQVRNELYRRVDSMFQVASENAVLAPGDFERVWLYHGTAPGTLAGEFWRTVMQFKSYTLAYMDRVLVQGWKDADTAQQKLGWALSMMIGTLPLSVGSIFFDNLSNNLTMPDWNQMNVPEREKYLVELLAPSLAMFTGILDPRSQNSNMIVDAALGSPSTRLISNAMASASALVTGDPKRAAKDLKKVANYMLPIQTTPIVSPALRYIMGDEAYLEPGQKVRFGS
ncbi:hypothetical protein KW791_00095 [Candidatus Parcubacteria bacterium]|nr:hypothetical protein [Candidatus Parcubacteria bacterium]